MAAAAESQPQMGQHHKTPSPQWNSVGCGWRDGVAKIPLRFFVGVLFSLLSFSDRKRVLVGRGRWKNYRRSKSSKTMTTRRRREEQDEKDEVECGRVGVNADYQK